MACNGNNHHPACDCGWGGVWYGNAGYGSSEPSLDDDSWLFRSPLDRERESGRQHETWTRWSTGLVNPNARCPECGEPVYFYASPYGGRVFFDELGPPWPKHPCTDRSTFSNYQPTLSAETAGGQGQWWVSQGWTPLQNTIIARHEIGRGIFVIEEYTGGFRIKWLEYPDLHRRLYFRAAQTVSASAIRIKKASTGPGQYRISILDYEERKGQWTTWEGIAFVSLEALLKSQSFCMRLPVGILPMISNK